MKLIPLLTVVTTLALVPSSHAEDQASDRPSSRDGFGHSRKHMMMKRAFGKLDLTDAQKSEIKDVLKSRREAVGPKFRELLREKRELRELTHASALDEAAVREQVEAMSGLFADLAVERAKTGREVRQILTPEQASELEGMRERMQERVDEKLERFGRRGSDL